MDTKPFLQYDSDSNKVKPLGFLGKEVNDTKAWTEISQTLVEAGKELRMVLPVIKLDKNEMRGKYGMGVGSTRDQGAFTGWHRHSKVNSVRQPSSRTWKSKIQIDIPALP